MVALRSACNGKLKGKELKEAQGACPNALYAPASIKTPLLSEELKEAPSLAIRKVYEYDIATQPGKRYSFVALIK